MLEQIIYKNHLNETVVFGSDGLYAFSNDLRDYTWGFEEKNNKISSFKRGVVGKSLPIIIVCNTEDEGISVRNRIFETMEKDVLAKKHGTIIIGDYYLKCYITGISSVFPAFPIKCSKGSAMHIVTKVENKTSMTNLLYGVVAIFTYFFFFLVL